MTARLYFDESIFEAGFALRRYSTFRVHNAADKFLAERIGKTTVSDPCESSSSESESESEGSDAFADKTIVNLNPREPCRGINVYTLNIINKAVISTLPINRIRVELSGDFYPIYIGEPTQIGVNRYTIGRLSAVESALMLKYFAICGKISVSVELYLLVNRWFVDYREWFELAEDLGIVETQNHDLLLGGKPVNFSDFGFHGPPIRLL